MSKKINPKELKLDQNLLNDIPIQGQLNIEALVFRQIERTHQAAVQDEAVFASNVRLLLNLLPTHKRDEIVERSDEYTSTAEHLEFKYWCGVPLGTVENPVNGSPYKVTEEVIDWYKMLEIILSAFEEVGVTWKTESWTVEAGKVNEALPNMPTPVYKKAKPEPVVEERIKVCAVCAERVTRGTGTNYKGRLIHKECKPLAEEKLEETEEA